MNSIARQTGVLDATRAWWRCHGVTLGLLLADSFTSSRDGFPVRLALGRRTSRRPTFSSVLHSFLAVQIVEWLGLAPAHTEWAPLNDGLALTPLGGSFSVGTVDIIDECAVRAVRADERTKLTELCEKCSQGMFRQVVLHTSDEKRGDVGVSGWQDIVRRWR